MATETTSTVIALFTNRESAERAVSALSSAGYTQDHVSVVSGDTRGNEHETPNLDPVLTPGSFDAPTGAAIGGFAGFVGGILALAIPGIGPIIAAGPLAAAIMGASVGAAAGGLLGGLKEHGVPENDAHRVAEAIRNGRTMVAVHAPHDHAGKVADILDENGALDTTDVEGDATGIPGSVTPVTYNPRAGVPFTTEDSLVERQKENERRSDIYPGITGSGSGPNS
ncbi:MAG: general stress protein [Bryobacteraceae bacterium]|nr:general stress protein [Bryobacteraceae bacterium]